MFLSRIFSYFWGPREEESLEDAYKILAQSESVEATTEINNEEIHDKSSIKKTGIITARGKGNLYTIDEVHKYSCDSEFEVGTKVSYTLYRDGVAQKITNVKPIVDAWDDSVYETGDEKKWFHSTKIGEVVKRDGRMIYVTPGDIKVNLNIVESEFIPKIGDWLQMDVKSVLDAGVLNYCGDTLEITKIYPLRSKIIHGFVQSYNQITFTGHINNNVYFDRECLSEGYIPRKGDGVLTEVIESNQGVYDWRAIKVIMRNTMGDLDSVDFDLPKLINYEDDVEGIKITDDIYVQSSGFKDNVFFHVEISNDSDTAVVLEDVKFDSRVSQVKLVEPDLCKPMEIEVGCTKTLKFVINVKSMGETVETLIFVFSGFNIGRIVRISLQSRVNKYNTRFNNYNNRNSNVAMMKNIRRKDNNELIRGEHITTAPRFSLIRMMEYKVPNNLWDIFLQYEEDRADRGRIYERITNEIDCFKSDVNYLNYEKRFHTLLHIDEIEAIVGMRKYDKDFACFIKNQDFLMLEVENLSEMRPSIIVGDKIIATSMDEKPKKFEGCIHKVTGKHIYLKFAPLMHEAFNGECYSVHVVQSRMPMRKLHHAISLAVKNLGQDFLFPSKVTVKEAQCSFTYDRYDDCVVENNLKKANEIVPRIQKQKTNKDILEAMRNNLAKSGYNNKNINDKENSSTSENLNISCDNESINKSSELKLNVACESNLNESNKIYLRTNRELKLKLVWHDKKLNYFQKEAVRNILLGEARPLPYIIFGPPGTGKTVTVVESIVQILKMVPGARLLVATPSNSAADILALRLIENVNMKPGEMARFVSYKYASEDLIPSKLLPYSCTGNIGKPGTVDDEVVCDNGMKLGCSFRTLGRHLVTVGTCGSIGNMHNMGFPKGHFTHVIIDEAGQCTEPEIMIPLTFLDIKQGQAILAGDPMQLGPVILSKEAAEFGLSESFLERMLGRFPYIRDTEGFPATDGYDPKLVTRLVYNYRSLPGIIKIPNDMFYHSELRPTLNESSIEYKMLDQVKEILPCNDPSPPSLVFHGLNSQNYQLEDSPSWFNPDEASQVFFYLNELYRLGLKSTDIGIISPYIRQVKQIREICREAEFEVPKVGTVEEFQGSEYNVIILSTVRSNKDFISSDVKHSLGFISNPKRLNVALTRAQVLCIIIGNPFLLIHDVHWRTVITHCIQNGAYTGCEFKETT